MGINKRCSYRLSLLGDLNDFSWLANVAENWICVVTGRVATKPGSALVRRATLEQCEDRVLMATILGTAQTFAVLGASTVTNTARPPSSETWVSAQDPPSLDFLRVSSPE